MKKTIWVYHKSYNGATYSYVCELDPWKVGDPIPDDIRVFDTEGAAREYASSFNCTIDKITGEKYSPDYKYLSTMEIDIK